MPCFHPLEAFQSPLLNEAGVRPVIFNPVKGQAQGWNRIKLPCGQCSGCRLERSRQWAVRCMHEAQMHKYNCFITLTFSDQCLYARDNPFTVDVREFQLFMKRLRKKYGSGIRFYHCGEYGEVCRVCGKSKRLCKCSTFYASIGRPHYHACIFGFDFPDKQFYKVSSSGCPLYISPSLLKLWPYGFSTIGELTFESAAYTARYVMKKINGKMANDLDERFGLYHYERMNIHTGEVFQCHPEYTTMSRRPGIGKTWYEKYSSDVYPHDYIVVNGVKCKPPKYYDNQLEITRPYIFEDVKEKRILDSIENMEEHTPERLAVRETYHNHKIAKFHRDL
jgi:hypothetical protein